jgi:hypothetical protein
MKSRTNSKVAHQMESKCKMASGKEGKTIKVQVSIRSQFIDTDDKIAGERKDSGQLREDKKDVNNVVAFAYLNEPKCRTCRSFDAW